MLYFFGHLIVAILPYELFLWRLAAMSDIEIGLTEEFNLKERILYSILVGTLGNLLGIVNFWPAFFLVFLSSVAFQYAVFMYLFRFVKGEHYLKITITLMVFLSVIGITITYLFKMQILKLDLVTKDEVENVMRNLYWLTTAWVLAKSSVIGLICTYLSFLRYKLKTEMTSKRED